MTKTEYFVEVKDSPAEPWRLYGYGPWRTLTAARGCAVWRVTLSGLKRRQARVKRRVTRVTERVVPWKRGARVCLGE